MKSKSLPALQGVIPPVITPMIDDLTVDEPAFRKLLDRCITHGVDALFVGGTAGLGPLLPDAAWVRMAEAAIAHVAGRIPLMVGVMETSTARAISRIRVLESMGYERFVLTPTFYCAPRTNEEFLAHFGKCRAATEMEMIAYNIPACTGSSLTIDCLVGMCRRGWIRNCKESSGDRSFFAKLCERGGEEGLGVFQGNKPELALLHAQGAKGIVPVPANVFPDEFVNAWGHRGETPEIVAQHQARVETLWNLLVSDWNFISGSAAALARLGVGTGHLLSPLQPPDVNTLERILNFPALLKTQ